MDYIKCLIIIAFSIIQLSTVSSGPVQDYIKCRAETNVSTKEVTRIQTLHLPETQEGKCYITCLMKSIGLINTEGLFDQNKTLDLSRKYAKDPSSYLKMQTIVVECGEKANEGGENDECAHSFIFMRCALTRRGDDTTTALRTRRNLPEINISLPPVTFVLAMLSLL